jgi:hypothetical protein
VVLSASAELLLPVGAIAFYLYDSLLWLYGDELVLIRDARRWWSAAGSDWLLLRRRLYLPNPFAPQRPLWRACWSAGTRAAEPGDLKALAALQIALRPLGVLVFLEMLLIVCALPVCVYIGLTPLALLVVLGAIYLTALGAVTWIWWHRDALGLTARNCRSLTVDALACPPFAINLVRKISLLGAVRGDLLPQALAVFEPAAFEGLRATLLRRVAEQLAAATEGSPAQAELLRYQHQLQEQRP